MNEKQRLQKIINENIELAEDGSLSAKMQVIAAQADLDRIAQAESDEIDHIIAINGLPLQMESLVF